MATVGLIAGLIAGTLAGGALAAAAAAAILELVAVAFTVQGLVAGSKKAPDTAPNTTNLDHLRSITRDGNAPARFIFGYAKVSGVLVYAQSADRNGIANPSGDDDPTDPKAKFLHMVMAVAVGPIDSFETVYLNDLPITDTGYRGKAIAIEQLGFTGQGAVRGPVTMGGSTEVQIPPDWTAAHRGDGVAYLYIILNHDREVFRAGAPQVRAVVRGLRMYDPRLDVSRGGTHVRHDEYTWEFSRNPAVALYTYMTWPEQGGGLGVPPDDIDEDAMMTAADVCDEVVMSYISAEETVDEARYTCDGVFETNGNRLSIVDGLKAAMAGDLVQRNGKFYIYAGVELTDQNGRPVDDPLWEPDFVINADSLRDEPLQILPAPGRAERANQITGAYINEDGDRYEVDSFRPVSAPNWIDEDGGVLLADPIDLPFTVGHARAQRLGALQLRKKRLWAISGSAKTNFSLADVTPYSLGAIYLPELGWNGVTYPQGKPIIALRTTLNPDGGCDIEWQEYDRDAFDIGAPDIPIIDHTPGTTLPSPFVVQPPRRVTAYATAYRLPDGSRVARVSVIWEPPPNTIVDHYVVGYRHTGSDEYIEVTAPNTTRIHVAGIITTGLAAKAATAQAVGDTTIVCTTAASTGACALLEGDIVRFAGSGTPYVLMASATQGTPSSDVTLSIDPGLSVALAGGEAVSVRSDYADLQLDFTASREGLYTMYVSSVLVTGVRSRKIHTSTAVTFAMLPPPDIKSFRFFLTGTDQRRFEWRLEKTEPPDTRGYQIRLRGPYGTSGEVPSSEPNTQWPLARVLGGGANTQITTTARSFETSLPTEDGWYLFLIKAIDTTGLESNNAIELIAQIPADALPNILKRGEEAERGWPGTLRNGRISTVGNDLESTSRLGWDDVATWADLTTWGKTPRALTYDTLEIDLGAVFTVKVDAFTNVRDADVAVTYRVRSEGFAYGARFQPLIEGITGRYLQLRLTASAPAADRSVPFIVYRFGWRITALVAEERVEDYPPESIDGDTVILQRIEEYSRWWRRGDLANCVIRNPTAGQNAALGAVMADACALGLNQEATLTQYASAPSHDAYILTNAWTFRARVRFADPTQTNVVIMGRGTQFAMRFKAVDDPAPVVDLVSFFFSGEDMAPHTQMRLTDARLRSPDDGGALHDIAYAHDGSLLRGYVDGVELVTQPLSFALFSPVGEAFKIGHHSTASAYAKMDIQEVQLWNRALSADEIGATVDGPLQGDEVGLIGYWRFDNSDEDLSPTGNDMVRATAAGDVPDFVRVGTRFSPPFDVGVVGLLTGQRIVSHEATVAVDQSVDVAMSADNGVTWLASPNTWPAPFNAGEQFIGQYLRVRQILRSTDPDTTPALTKVSVVASRIQVPGDYVYVPRVAFASVDSAQIIAVQDIAIGGSPINAAIVAKAPHGIRYTLTEVDSGDPAEGATVDLLIRGARLA